jgi:hypothetical protein
LARLARVPVALGDGRLVTDDLKGAEGKNLDTRFGWLRSLRIAVAGMMLHSLFSREACAAGTSAADTPNLSDSTPRRSMGQGNHDAARISNSLTIRHTRNQNSTASVPVK